MIRMVGESQEAVGAAAAGGGSSGSNKLPTLEEYGTNLTDKAEQVSCFQESCPCWLLVDGRILLFALSCTRCSVLHATCLSFRDALIVLVEHMRQSFLGKDLAFTCFNWHTALLAVWCYCWSAKGASIGL